MVGPHYTFKLRETVNNFIYQRTFYYIKLYSVHAVKGEKQVYLLKQEGFK